MPKRQKKPGRVPSREERHRMKSARPRRRLAKEAAKKRMLSDRNARRRFFEILPNPTDFNRNHIAKSDARILGAGKGKLTVSLGTFVDPKTGKSVHYAFKIYRMDDVMVEEHKNFMLGGPQPFCRTRLPLVKDAAFFDGHYFIGPYGFPELQVEERRLRKIASLGIPTTFAKAIVTDTGGGIPRSSVGFLLVEDLSQGGRFQVKEFHGFDFSQVSNGNELRKLFEDYHVRLVKARVRISDESRHWEDSSLRDEVEKTFFVVIDPKTRKGKLVAGDADQIEF